MVLLCKRKGEFCGRKLVKKKNTLISIRHIFFLFISSEVIQSLSAHISVIKIHQTFSYLAYDYRKWDFWVAFPSNVSLEQFGIQDQTNISL